MLADHDASAEMLSAMSACAHRLGMAFGREAEAAEDTDRKLALFQLFDRCFFSVRVAITLRLRLERSARAARPAGMAVADPSERNPSETERPESDPPEYERPERLNADRERESEGAGLPILLKTLHGVAAAAAALPGPQPAELPTLRELLARVTGEPAPAATPRTNGLRARLAGSATVAVTTRPPPAARALFRPPRRTATGPPRR